MKEYIITDDFIDDFTKKFASAQGQLTELIRCKDCKFYEPESYQCTMVIGTWFPEEYCNSSERKEK